MSTTTTTRRRLTRSVQALAFDAVNDAEAWLAVDGTDSATWRCLEAAREWIVAGQSEAASLALKGAAEHLLADWNDEAAAISAALCIGRAQAILA